MDITPDNGSLELAAASRKSFLLLRWLLIILAAYLTLFTNIEEPNVGGIFLLVTAFALSNVLISLLSLQVVMASRSRHVLATVDSVFICAFLYHLRVDQAQLHLPFMGVVVLAILWPDLRIVLFALFVVSLLFGLLTNFQLFASRINVPLDDFLALSLFFVVSIFYIFMIDRFNRDAETSAALIQERHNAENISDIARKLSTSLESTDIQMMLVGRFTEIMPGVKCSIVRINSAKDGAEIVASSDPKTPSAVSFDDAPALHEAMQRKDTAVAIVGSGDPNEVGSDSRALDTLAVPMVSRDEVIALIYLEKTHDGISPWERSIKFVEIVASTAANALANAERFDKMKQMASTDSLTKLANHGSFKTRLLHEIDRAKRHSRMFSLLLIDLDLLKSINDKFGHPLGDRMIRSVADAIRITCRETDLGARYGGEEFAVILPETDLSGGMQMAERLRQRIEGIDWFPAKITASIGAASFPVHAETGEDLIAVADEAMYIAKSRGRNQVASLSDLV